MKLLIFLFITFYIISFIFSMLGMGGSQLYIPVLYFFGFDLKTQALPLGLFLNLTSVLSSSITYIRKKLINYKMAIPFAISLIFFTPLGSYFSFKANDLLITITFALFSLIAAIYMLLKKMNKDVKIDKKKAIILSIISGAILGFLAGFIGRGGGSFIVPILYTLNIPVKEAAGTSSFIVTFSSFIALISHLFLFNKINIVVWLTTMIAVILGSQTGSNFMAKNLDNKKIKIIFAIILIFTSILMVLKAYLKT